MILVGGVLPTNCVQMGQEPYVDVQGRKVGLNAVCFDKPSGTIDWYLEYQPTIPCTFPATMDLGSRVMVYGADGVLSQPFTLKWVHSTGTVIPEPPPAC